MLNGIEAMKDSSGELIVTSKKPPDNQLLITVNDSGIGIAPGSSRSHLRGVLHHQTAGHRHGIIDQSEDHRLPWRPLVGERKLRTGHNFSVHIAQRLRAT
jgi:hypothetical protein